MQFSPSKVYKIETMAQFSYTIMFVISVLTKGSGPNIQSDTMCDLAAAMISDPVFLSWNCSSIGIPSLGVCSYYPSHWTGVTCSSINGNVTSIVLSGHDIVGSIPSSLGSLKFLSYLDLSKNKLRGELPTSIGSLSNLKHFDASSNNFTGSIPVEFGIMSSITLLDLVKPSTSSINSTTTCNVPHIEDIGDADCDFEAPYNTAACNWDGGDCCPQSCGAFVNCGETAHLCDWKAGGCCLDPRYQPSPTLTPTISHPPTLAPTNPCEAGYYGNGAPAPGSTHCDVISTGLLQSEAGGIVVAVGFLFIVGLTLRVIPDIWWTVSLDHTRNALYYSGQN
eukprot:gene1825-3536_t